MVGGVAMYLPEQVLHVILPPDHESALRLCTRRWNVSRQNSSKVVPPPLATELKRRGRRVVVQNHLPPQMSRDVVLPRRDRHCALLHVARRYHYPPCINIALKKYVPVVLGV
jgi:hypothetical protein